MYIRWILVLALFGLGMWVSFTAGYFSGYERKTLASVNSSWTVYRMAERFMESMPERLECHGHLETVSEWLWGDIMTSKMVLDEKRNPVGEAIYFPTFIRSLPKQTVPPELDQLIREAHTENERKRAL